MAMRLAVVVRNKQLDQLRADFDNGYLRFYTGAMEANPETTEAGTLLAELRLNTTAYPAASGGVATFNSITQDSDADQTGTAAHFRILKSDGTTALMEGDISTSGAAINLNSTAIQQHATVSVTAFSWTVPM